MSVPKTMKALVAYGQGDYRFEENYPVPDLGPDDLLIKTEGCGICAGDLVTDSTIFVTFASFRDLRVSS